MSRTRDLIQEIADVRQRRQFGSAMSELPLRLFALEKAFKDHDRKQQEFTRYFPVALIATIEGYFRMAVKDLVDAGEPYLSNSERLASTIKLDFSIIRSVHGKSITIGELVAHAVPLSRLEHIEAAISSLLGTSFLAKLRVTTDRWPHEIKGESAEPLLTEPDQVFAAVARMFELRHIICHELASAYEIEYDEVAKCFESCVQFLRASDELVSETLHPGAPLTQADMNIAAGKSLNTCRAKLTQTVNTLRSRLDASEAEAFDTSQEKWEQYCTAWSDFVSSEILGGSMWPAVRSYAEECTVQKRLDEVLNYRRIGEQK
jgi:uncharacterized protein YecT (DUF1311 family)